MIRRPPRSTPLYSSAASDVYKRQKRMMTQSYGWKPQRLQHSQNEMNDGMQDDDRRGMSVAELEARVRLELNRKLACINTFLQQRADHLEQIDNTTDSRTSQIRAQLQSAETQLRVCIPFIMNVSNNVFNGLVSRTARVSWYRDKPFWALLKREMTG